MMPDALIVAFRTSVSNHWSRKSAALIVSSWTWLMRSCALIPRNRLPMDSSSSRPRGSSDVGSGGVIDRMGLAKRPISIIARPYSS